MQKVFSKTILTIIVIGVVITGFAAKNMLEPVLQESEFPNGHAKVSKYQIEEFEYKNEKGEVASYYYELALYADGNRFFIRNPEKSELIQYEEKVSPGDTVKLYHEPNPDKYTNGYKMISLYNNGINVINYKAIIQAQQKKTIQSIKLGSGITLTGLLFWAIYFFYYNKKINS